MMKMKKNKKNKKINEIKLPLIPVLLSTVMLIYGTYAWFTYFSDVDSTMTGHVIGWNIDFDGSTNIENEYEIIINNIYPGMDDYVNEFNITNSGEASAKITSDIKSISIFDDMYKIGDELDGEILNNKNFFELLNKKYSFKFSTGISKDIIHTNEKSVFSFSLVWPYETYIKLPDGSLFDKEKEYFMLNEENFTKIELNSTTFEENKDNIYILNDENDTLWGSKAYDFKQLNPDIPAIKLEIIINATQYIE